MARPDRRIVLLAMPRRYWLARRAALGIAAYAREHAGWELLMLPHEAAEKTPVPADVGACGAIVSLGGAAAGRFIRCPEPVVVLDNPIPPGTRPSVVTDGAALGRMAADYFLDRGYYHFGYVSGGATAGDGWWGGFEARITAHAASTFSVLPAALRLGRRPYDEALGLVANWLQQLPKPSAVLTCDDQHGVVTIQAARLASLRVPEDVSVLGVQDEGIFRELGHVSLSSIALAAERMGFEAARMLHGLLEGRSVSREPLRVPPVEVITRRSTDCRVVADPDVRTALTWISHHLHERFAVVDLLNAVAMSRSSIERRFKASLGRTPHEEVLRQRVERARTLLVDTDWDLKQIAAACGFAGREYFGNVFKKATGESPAAYRRRFLRRGEDGGGGGATPRK